MFAFKPNQSDFQSPVQVMISLFLHLPSAAQIWAFFLSLRPSVAQKQKVWVTYFVLYNEFCVALPSGKCPCRKTCF